MKYILISSLCLSITYLVYRLLFRKETNFRQLRTYLLFSILISVLLPFNNIKINSGVLQDQSVFVPKAIPKSNELNISQINDNEIAINKSKESSIRTIDWIKVIKSIYFAVALVLVIRILSQVFILINRYIRSDKKRETNFVLIYNHGFESSFSFFNWIFINDEQKSERDIQNIIAHEIIHANQYHSFDLIVIELLIAVMWFNPLIWMMRKSIHLVHEYLADEGVLNAGIDKLNYQELLINQVAEEKLIHISSSFNKSLIKKRIIMMNNEKITKRIKRKALVLIPASIFLFLGVACVNGPKEENSKIVAAVAPTKMNVLYLGIDNPVTIAVSGYKSSEIDVEILDDAGNISGTNGEYMITPNKPGKLTLAVKADGNIVQETVFRVKGLPDPVAMVNRQKGGEIDKNTLLEQKEVFAFMERFDFDLNFEVVSFIVSHTNSDGFFKSVTSNSNNITEEQKELINNAVIGSRINFEDIKAKGPDGNIKMLSPIVFEIVE